MNRRHTMVLEQPATRWEDALPSGNGKVGAMVYGNIHRDTILVNHESLWLPLWSTPELPDMAPHLPRYRRLFEQLKFQEADRFWRRKLAEQNWPACIYTNPSHPAFDLKIEQRIDRAFENYQRRLDFRTGEVTVAWTEDGARFARQLFVSRADDVIVLRIRCGRPGRVDIAAALAQHPLLQDNLKTLHYPRSFTPEEIPLQCRPSARQGWLRMDGRYPAKEGYSGLARVLPTGGTMATRNGRVVVAGADEVLILLQVVNHAEDPLAARAMRARINALPNDYTVLLRRHRRLHASLYTRVELDLDSGAELGDVNETLLAKAYRKQAPRALQEKLFHYGRYLFISSTHQGGWPPHLQGLWNGDYIPAWSGDYTLDENIQMHHWHVMPGNLPELMHPYFRYLEKSIPDWQQNARAFFGCRGVMTCLRQSDHGLMVENMPYMIWVAGAGWMGQAYYDYYLYTGDRDFLRDHVVPYLKEVALFFEDFLYEGPDGRFIVSPSMSPENIPDIPGGTRPSMNATMDIFVIREVLRNLCTACAVLNRDVENIRKWKGMLAKLPDIRCNRDGAIREWQHPQLKDNYHHRHQSHVYGLFPGFEITQEETPQLFEACRVAIEKRLVVGIKSQTGWSLAHMSNVFARLGWGDRALECLDLLTRACVWPNFLTCHDDARQQGITMGDPDYKKSVFQVDANMGFTGAILEMLAFSVPGSISVLPALPRRWKRGAIRGVLCRGGIVLSVRWDRPARRLELELKSRTRQALTLKLPAWASRLSLQAEGGAIQGSPRGVRYRTLRLPGRRTTVIRPARPARSG